MMVQVSCFTFPDKSHSQSMRRKGILIFAVSPSPFLRIGSKPLTIPIVDDSSLWDNLRAPFIDKLGEASRALEKMRISNEAAIQAELTALAFEVMANKRRLSSVCVTDDEWSERRDLAERPGQ